MTQNEQIKGLSKMTGLSQAAIKDVITCHGQLLAAVLAGGGALNYRAWVILALKRQRHGVGAIPVPVRRLISRRASG